MIAMKFTIELDGPFDSPNDRTATEPIGLRAIRPKPSSGLEPETPSLPSKSSARTGGQPGASSGPFVLRRRGLVVSVGSLGRSRVPRPVYA
jgi:hypothetical protein